MAVFTDYTLDIKLVTVPEGETPTLENSEEIGGEEGRGSLVFFNQASMFQSSETNSPTLSAAAKGKKGVVTDYGPNLHDALSTYGIQRPVDFLHPSCRS